MRSFHIPPVPHGLPLALTRRRKLWMPLALGLVPLLVLGAGLAYIIPRAAHAATTTHLTTCDDATLSGAILAAAPGDTIELDCSGTIAVTETLTIFQNLTLQTGPGQRVTLDGGHVASDPTSGVRVLQVNSGVSFALSGLTVANGLALGAAASTDYGGGLYNDGGTVALTNCTFTGNMAQGGDNPNGTGGNGNGGGVASSNGSLTLTNCTFTGNTAQGGDNFSGYYAAGIGNGGGIYITAGTLSVTNSTFTGNLAQGGANSSGSGFGGGPANGGAVYSDGGTSPSGSATLTLTGSTFTGNMAQGGRNAYNGGGGPAEGGAVYSDGGGGRGIFTVSNCTFTGNTAQGGVNSGFANGGAVESMRSTSTVTNSAFISNTAKSGFGSFGQVIGGGLDSYYEMLTVTSSTFTDNTALGNNGPVEGAESYGGGLTISNAISASVTGSTFAGNIAQGGAANSVGAYGGPAYGGGIWVTPGGSVTLTNDTLTANQALGGADTSGPGGEAHGGALNTSTSGNVSITNLTLDANRVQGGSGTSNGVSQGGALWAAGTITVQNSILADSTLGNGTSPTANCAISGVLTDADHNLESGSDCGLAASTDHQKTDPKLGPLANNGGPTATMALLAESPAINAGGTSANDCPATDQRGVSRPQGAACDIGAFERVPTASTTALTANPNPVAQGQNLQLCATVAGVATPGTPAGTITFTDGSVTLGTATLSGGTACLNTTSLALGTHSITASYSGDGSFNPSTSAPLSVTVGVPGQDVIGGSSGGGPPHTTGGTSSGTSQTGSTSGQPSGGSTTTAHPSGRHTPSKPAQGFPWWLLAGILLLLLGLGGLLVVIVRIQRAPAPTRSLT